MLFLYSRPCLKTQRCIIFISRGLNFWTLIICRAELIVLQSHTKPLNCVYGRCFRVQMSSCRRFTRTTRGRCGRRSEGWQTARRSWRKPVGSVRDSAESRLISWWNKVHIPAHLLVPIWWEPINPKKKILIILYCRHMLIACILKGICIISETMLETGHTHLKYPKLGGCPFKLKETMKIKGTMDSHTDKKRYFLRWN